jgi:outer membrane protein
VGTARAPLLPQVIGSASYTRGTFNSPLQGAAKHSLDTRDGFGATLRATQLIYDFGQTYHLKDAAEANAQAQEQTEHATELEIAYGVRSAFLSAGANRALVDVAHATLSNQERHLTQIQGFVEVGTRAPIDLAQARTDVATAKLSLIRAENNYSASRAQLSRSMGTPNQTDYEVSAALPAAEESETVSLDGLMQLAERQRPEFAAIQQQLAAEEATLSSIKGQYGPSLSAVGTLDEQGYRLSSIATNLSVGLNLSWAIFQGGLTNSRVDEARAVINQIGAQLDTLRQDLRVALTQAELAIQAAQAELVAADDLVELAKERVTLADGRYQAGVGNIIELGDAELALRDAQTQRVTAEYDLASARALLHRTLGRM